MKNSIITNWRTTLLGGGAFTGAITLLVSHPDQWQAALGLALTGLLGLLSSDGANKPPAA